MSDANKESRDVLRGEDVSNLSPSGAVVDAERAPDEQNHAPVKFLTAQSIFMGLLVSMGGFIFGYDTGQISGFLATKDFLRRFGQLQNGAYAFTNVRSGLIVGLLSIGCLVGALAVAPLADAIGRKFSISFWSLIFSIGVIVQIASETSWVQLAIGRLIAGMGVGSLSILTPMYVSETGPRQVRGALVSTYQLFITAGIFLADAMNFGTETLSGSASWRIVMGLGLLWPVVLGFGVLFFPESPRYAYRRGRVDEASQTMAKFYGVPTSHRIVRQEMADIKAKHEEDLKYKRSWTELVTGPRMLHRTLLGIVLQALQQLTGANFFFYYGTTIFEATGLSNSYETAMVLGVINFGMTFLGLYVVEKYGRRRSLIIGGIGMTISFLVFASVGSFSLDNASPMATPKAGAAMIVFACLFIAFYAVTWGFVMTKNWLIQADGMGID